MIPFSKVSNQVFSWFLIAFLSVAIICLSYVLFRSIKKNLELVERHEELGTQVEESLDILNDCYARISKVIELPVVSDDPVVKQLIQDIVRCRNSILLIANKLVVFDTVIEEEEDVN
jgi:hypothetical protein